MLRRLLDGFFHLTEHRSTVRTEVVAGLTTFLTMAYTFPLVRMIGSGYASPGGAVLYPIVAPALILVGTMMIGAVRHIPWDEPDEAIPAFLTMTVMPLAVSITDGIAFGVIAYVVLKLAVGRAREAHWLLNLFAVLFLAGYLWLSK
jgi:AGZA family xanthine/uracil permease-like MFS transporter